MSSFAVDHEALTDGELADLVLECSRRRSEAEAAELAAIAAFDARDVYALDGATCAASWIAARTDCSRPQASSMVKHGRLLRSHDRSAQALASFGTTKVRAILAAVNDRTRDAFDRDEAWLLDAAAPLTVDQTRTFVAAWLQNVDQQGVDPKPARHSQLK